MSRLLRVLSIDGGGIRGIVPGTILAEAEKEFGFKVADYFDLVTGTSTGGILGCAYLCPDPANPGKPKFTGDEVVGLYFKKGEQIFANPFGNKLKTLFGIINAKFPVTGIDEALKEYFGDIWLKDLLKPTVITSYDVTNRKGHFFYQHEAKQDKSYNFKVRDVCRATSAAPTYFACAHIPSEDGTTYTLVDGGVFVNNPAMVGYAEIREGFQRDQKSATAKDIKILSLGTGFSKQSYPYKKVISWGAAQWVRPIIDIMMSGSVDVDDFYLKQIYKTTDNEFQYLRINSKMPGDVDPEMDNASQQNMQALKALGLEMFDKGREDLKRWFEL